jgi:hypothetical protein
VGVERKEGWVVVADGGEGGAVYAVLAPTDALVAAEVVLCTLGGREQREVHRFDVAH